VTLDDLVTGVTLALDGPSAALCLASFDQDADDAVTIEELIAAVTGVFHGCAAPGKAP
jgi:hypothetical protein